MAASSAARDLHYLQHALRIGARNFGRTWPNPSVGCLLVNHGQVVGAAATAETGRPHAETQALQQAGEQARGATAYVTLEPCIHHGKTPPCAEALIAAGVSRVVIGCDDVDPRTATQSEAILTQAGITVDKILLPAVASTHRGFFRRVRHGLPYVGMKLATSLDGQMRDHNGKSQWITGERARAHGHRLRAQFDAIVTGIGTALDDDPQLTVRLPGADHSRLVRVVCDRHLRLPIASQLVKTAETQPTYVVTTAEGVEKAASHANDLRERGVTLVVLEDPALTPQNILHALSEAGITRVLVEAGPKLSTAFLSAACVDALYWYQAPMLLGSAGTSAVGPLEVALAEAKKARRMAQIPLGEDALEVYELAFMFTGLITARGTICRIEKQGDVTMEIAAPESLPLSIGASIACDGICLTVVEILKGSFTVQLSAETMRVTNAGSWKVGSEINLEPSLAVGDRLGGHFVSGHVDGLAVAIHTQPSGDSIVWTFEAPESLTKFLAPKGSVTINGVSLTVNMVEKNLFSVNIIPHTAQVTGFRSLKLLDKVNLEVDMLARYVARLQEFA